MTKAIKFWPPEVDGVFNTENCDYGVILRFYLEDHPFMQDLMRPVAEAWELKICGIYLPDVNWPFSFWLALTDITAKLVEFLLVYDFFVSTCNF